MPNHIYWLRRPSDALSIQSLSCHSSKHLRGVDTVLPPFILTGNQMRQGREGEIAPGHTVRFKGEPGLNFLGFSNKNPDAAHLIFLPQKPCGLVIYNCNSENTVLGVQFSKSQSLVHLEVRPSVSTGLKAVLCPFVSSRALSQLTFNIVVLF